MRSRNQFGLLIGASLLGLAVITIGAIAPRLYGGGGDEGGDILPASGGPTTGSAIDHAHPYVTVHGRDLSLDTQDLPFATGLVVGGHSKADIVVGLPTEGIQADATALDVLVKGRGKLAYSDFVDLSSPAAPTKMLHLNGRFELEDLDPTDGEAVQVRSRMRQPAVVATVLGHRKTHEGSVLLSFDRIVYMGFGYAPEGIVDLASLHDLGKGVLSGTDYDVAIGLYSKATRAFDEVWVAWNVADARTVYDVEVKLR
jgi:hypothetical protein